MENNLVEIGVGGIIAVQIIKTVLDFLSRQRNTDKIIKTVSNGASGEKDVSYWELKITTIVRGEILPMHDTLLRIEKLLEKNKT